MTAWARTTAVVALLVTVQVPAYAAKGQVLFHFQDPRLVENSALVDTGDAVFTITDSGSGPEVFMVDKTSGETIGVTTYAASDPVDVEALAAGPGHTVWVGDIGDNRAVRSHITLYELPTPTPGNRTVTPKSFDLVYRDGPRDAEALLIHPETGRVYVVSKGVLGGTVYAAPKRLRSDRTNVLVAAGSAPGIVTDGAFFPDGRHVLLRDYWSAEVLQASNFASLGRFDLPAQKQGEGIAIVGDDVLVSSEGENSPVQRARIPARLLQQLAPETPTPTPTRTTEPTAPAASTSSDKSWASWAVPVVLGLAWLVLVVAAVRAIRRRRARPSPVEPRRER